MDDYWFSISFDQGNDWLGGLKFLGLNHVGFAISKTISPHVPLALFMLFQMMFCTIAVSILSGSIAENEIYPLSYFCRFMGCIYL